jgi:probable rRNA maturation factor
MSAVVVRASTPAWRRALPGAASLLRRAARAALAAEAGPRRGPAPGRGTQPPAPGEVTVLLADDAAVRALNARHRGRNAPTDVLAFPNDAPGVLGDVVLAYETTAADAAAEGKRLADHAAHLVVHGVLHLLGHDHARAAEARRMEAAERRILASLGIADPYHAPAPAGRRAA